MEAIEVSIENWKDIQDLNSYQVSDLGRIRTSGRVVKYPTYSKSTPAKVIQSANNGKGYRYVTIQIQRKRKNYYVHRLVCAAFHVNPSNLPEVNHKDGDKTNNKASNLEWSSLQSNRDHARENNLIPFGERSTFATLKEGQVVSILNEFKRNPKANKTHVAIQYGIADTTVHKIVYGKRWSRLYKKWLVDNQIDLIEFMKSVRRWNLDKL